MPNPTAKASQPSDTAINPISVTFRLNGYYSECLFAQT
jgi:hypothetical protein